MARAPFNRAVALVMATLALTLITCTSWAQPVERRPRKCAPCIATVSLHKDDLILLQSSRWNSSYPGREAARQLRYIMELHAAPVLQTNSFRQRQQQDQEQQRPGGGGSTPAAQALVATAEATGPSTPEALACSKGKYLLQVVYRDSYHDIGWDKLQIIVNPIVPLPAWIKAHAMGYAEAFFTWPQMHDYWDNYRMNEFAASGGETNPDLLDFIDQQVAFVRDSAEAKQEGSKFWRLVGLVMSQFDGLVEGYQRNAAPDKALTWHDLYLLQSVGDLYDLNVLFPPGAKRLPPPAGAAEQPSAASPVRANATLSDRGGVASGGGGSGGGGAAAVVRAQWRWREGARFVPHHGAPPEPGQSYGDMLECSALIRIDNTTLLAGDGNGGSTMLATSKGGGWWARTVHALRRSVVWVLRSAWCGASCAREQQRQRQLEREGAHAPGAGREAAAQAESQRPAWGAQDKMDDPVPMWVGHATWRAFYAMIRSFKVYDVPWSETGPLVLSGSPGMLYSKDDWYTTDQLVVMETTLGIYNASLYEHIKPECVLLWQRVLVAMYGSSGGQEWTQLLAKHNSGTYNNQWMVLDVAALNRRWQHDLLWVIEQIPGYTQKADMSSVLIKTGQWASFNVPVFEKVYNLTGYPYEMQLWHNAPRARIFARDGPGVSCVSTLKRLLRYNRYQTDPLSNGRPDNAIAARDDLLPIQHVAPGRGGAVNWTRRAFGAVDAKLVDHQAFNSKQTHIICGPTADDQPPFRWSSSGFDKVQHHGMVDLFDFKWETFKVGDN